VPPARTEDCATENILGCVRWAVDRYPPAPELHCAAPVIGPLVTAFRKAAWRLLGLEHAFNEKQRQLNVSLSTLVDIERLARSWQRRPCSADGSIFDEVVLHNQYGLPGTFRPDDIVLDVGAHIGSFCLAALLRGARCVVGFEAERQNFELASANLQAFAGRVQVRHQAVWRSDRAGDRLFHAGSAMDNTGGGSLLFNTSGQEVDVVAFDDVVRELTEDGRRRIRLVKMDCEGSEFPILLTSRTLHLIDEIVGEFHEINDGVYNPAPITPVARVDGIERFTIGELTRCLQQAGFTVRSERNAGTFLGLFRATRAPLAA
jgi:FkbM family methyltransferase